MLNIIAHVKDVFKILTVLLEYIHFYHKNFKCDDCSIRVYLKFYTLTGTQIIVY